MLLPPSSFLQAIGVTSIQRRVSAFGNAVFWKTQAIRHTVDPSIRPVTTYGNVVGLDHTLKLISSVPEGSKYVRHTFAVADVDITDKYGAAAAVALIREEAVKFDVYPPDQAVVWVRGTPFNIKLIEAGYAKPDPNPPTGIVDDAFAAYYWRLFKGESND
jgi:multidrug efflux pump subunit AcrA (membrane-fusion protein)